MNMLTRAAARLRSRFVRPAPNDCTVPVARRMTIEATIIRANGDVEPLGTFISSGDPA